MSRTKQSDVVLDALRQALSIRHRYDAEFRAVGIIHHSDAGFQYTSSQLRKLIEREGITGSLLAPSVMPTIIAHGVYYRAVYKLEDRPSQDANVRHLDRG